MDLDFRRDPKLLTDIVDQMPAGVFTVDATGHFVAWNAGAERITGYSEGDVVGQSCHLLEGENCRGFSAVTDLLKEASPPLEMCTQECRILSRDGRPLHLHGNVRVIMDDQGQVAGAVGTFTDVSSFVLAHEKIALFQQQAGTDLAMGQIIGNSPPMLEVFRRIQLAADSDVSVLVTGESGTGKELVAKAIHALSRRKDQAFLGVNCSAISETLLESELFGYVKGAFTGANVDKIGVFEAADQGTLFLDEIGDVSPAIQVKLLRVLQERQLQRVGDPHPRSVNVRLVSATHRHLAQAVAEGKIREDFYYRIHVFEIHLPPLRERPEDIPALVDHFVQQICERSARRLEGVTQDALATLQHYHWPGNVRQLRNAIEHACVTVAGDRIGYLDLPPEIRETARRTATESLQQFSTSELAERRRIVDALRQTGGNRTRAAELLGVSRVTLWKKICRFDIELS